jgi:hypothetical protein
MAIGQGPGEILASITIDSTTDAAASGSFNVSRAVTTPTAGYTLTLNTSSVTSPDNILPLAVVEQAAGAGALFAYVTAVSAGVYDVAIVDAAGALKAGSGSRLHVSFFRSAI